MKLSELKQIIRECIEEMDEGVRRMNRVNNSKKFNSRSSKEWRKADLAFDTAAKKVARRNEKGIAKYGQVKFTNARLNRKKPVEESGPADRYRKKHGKVKDLTRDPLTLPNRKTGDKVGRGDETMFARQPPYDKKEKPSRGRYAYNVEKYNGDFKKLGKGKIK